MLSRVCLRTLVLLMVLCAATGLVLSRTASAATLTAPANGTVASSLRPTLSWTLKPGEMVSDVEFTTNCDELDYAGNGFMCPESGVTSYGQDFTLTPTQTSLTAPKLEPGLVFYWELNSGSPNCSVGVSASCATSADFGSPNPLTVGLARADVEIHWQTVPRHVDCDPVQHKTGVFFCSFDDYPDRAGTTTLYPEARGRTRMVTALRRYRPCRDSGGFCLPPHPSRNVTTVYQICDPAGTPLQPLHSGSHYLTILNNGCIRTPYVQVSLARRGEGSLVRRIVDRP